MAPFSASACDVHESTGRPAADAGQSRNSPAASPAGLIIGTRALKPHVAAAVRRARPGAVRNYPGADRYCSPRGASPTISTSLVAQRLDTFGNNAANAWTCPSLPGSLPGVMPHWLVSGPMTPRCTNSRTWSVETLLKGAVHVHAFHIESPSNPPCNDTTSAAACGPAAGRAGWTVRHTSPRPVRVTRLASRSRVSRHPEPS